MSGAGRRPRAPDTDPKTPNIPMHEADVERLASLLDARLDDVARAALLKRVDASPPTFETLVDAASIVEHLERDEAAADDAPDDDQPRPPRAP